MVIGVDVSKADFKLMLRCCDGWFGPVLKACNPQEIPEVVALAQELSAGRRLRVAMEPSGTYGDALRQALADGGVAAHRVSPKASHDYAEIFDGVPSQHDGKDAAIVAELCGIGKSKPWAWEQPDEWEQELAEQVEELDAQRRLFALWCGKLEGLLARHWPEASSILSVSSSTLLRALIQYQGPAALARDERAGENLARWGRAYLKAEKIAALIDSARQTVGVRQGPVDDRRLERLARRALEAKRQGDRAARRLKELGQKQPAILAMGSVVGVPTACVLWVCVGDPRDYPCGQAYCKAMGLNLAERSSGRYVGKLKISKRGSAMARRWMYLASLRLIRDHESVRAWYQRARVRAENAGALHYRSGAVAAAVGVMRRAVKALHPVATAGMAFEPQKLFPGKRLRIRDNREYNRAKGGEPIATL